MESFSTESAFFGDKKEDFSTAEHIPPISPSAFQTSKKESGEPIAAKFVPLNSPRKR